MPVFSIRGKKKMTFGMKDDIPMPSQMPRQPQTIQERKTGALQTPKIVPQTGIIKDPIRDASRSALLPGKRISRTGNVYWETRRNRSDALRSKL